jgi:large subunit ribosomal protein L3
LKDKKKSGKFVGIGKKKKPSKAELGKFGEGTVPEQSRVVKAEVESVDELITGDTINIVGTSKGKGFAGVIRMWKFKGGKRTHGQSDRQRHAGSIGAGTTPGRVFKGKKMGRRKGSERVTVKGYRVISVDNENKLICVKGSVPGTYDSVVEIYKR